MKKSKWPKKLAADGFRRDAKRLIYSYSQRTGMLGDSLLWGRIVERYESLLPAEMKRRAKDL